MRRTPQLVAVIGGVVTPITAFDATHGVDQPIGAGSVSLPMPLPEHLFGSDMKLYSSAITVQAGFAETGMRPRFIGMLVGETLRIDPGGKTATLAIQGNAARLSYPTEEKMTFAANTLLREVVRAFCAMRGVACRVDRMTYPGTGVDVALGGNTNIDEGQLVIPAGTVPLDWIARMVRLFGYRAFETPGEFRVQRVSGAPVGSIHGTYAEGSTAEIGHAYRMEKRGTSNTVRTFWTVEGPTYTDADGVQIPIRSIPAEVPPSPYLGGRYRSDRVSDRNLVRFDLAHAVRNVYEIDYSTPEKVYAWETTGDPTIYPGDVVRFESSSMGVAGNQWLMSVRDSVDSRSGYVASMTAWAGGGAPLAAGDDAVMITVGGGPWHVGDERVSWYAVPTPGGNEVPVNFTVPDTFTSIAVSFLGHGMNSQLIGGANSDLNVSKLEVWQGGDKAVGSVNLPVMPEDYALRRPYGAGDTWWVKGRLPVPGSVKPGPAVLKFIAGGTDDFEVKNIIVELRGVGMPILPGLG